VPHPEIDVSYRAYGLTTLARHAKALMGQRRRYLVGADRSIIWLAIRLVQRSLMFNRITVKMFWLPLFEAAEHSAWWAGMVRENMYRGVVVHYFQMGCRDGKRLYGDHRHTGFKGAD
jgi:hypothetical protein